MQVLREMDRLSRTGFILNDIRRCLAGYVAAWGASRVATRNRLTRHDMPLSVLRAYTPDELRALLRQAGIPDATVTTHPLFRMAAVHRQGSAPDVPELDADAIVVGGGPAGSVSAWLLAERGHRVLLLDKARFPRHKACSEYVNPAGARLLAELGLASDLQALGAHRMEAMLIHAPGGRRFLADFGVAEPGSAAIGLSRYRLDSLLLDRAREAGVEVREGAHVRSVLVADGCVQGVECTIDGVRTTLRAPLTIGADGRHGVVSRALGLDIPLRWPRRTGLVAHYRRSHRARRLGRDARRPTPAMATRVWRRWRRDLTNVAFVTASAAVANRPGSLEAFFEEGLAGIPAIASRLTGAERVGGIRGVGSMAHRARRVSGDGFALVGDAASFLDPFTGEGVYEALRGATLLAPVADAALRAGDLSAQAACALWRRAAPRVLGETTGLLAGAGIHHHARADGLRHRASRSPPYSRTDPGRGTGRSLPGAPGALTGLPGAAAPAMTCRPTCSGYPRSLSDAR